MRSGTVRAVCMSVLAAGLAAAHADIIHVVAQSGQVGELKRLVSRGVSVDARDERGMTPLMHAATAGNIRAVQYLLEAKANLSLTDSLDRDALDCALYAGKHDVARVLVQNKADVERMYASGLTRLTLAAARGDIASVQFLLMSGAQRDRPSRDGVTALQVAEKAGSDVTVELLKAYTAPAPMSPPKGLSPADSAKLYSVKEYAHGEDVLAAIQAGRRSLAGCAMKELDLAGMNFSFLDLRGAVLDGSDLRGALFLGARLGKASLRNAYLRKANFQRADVAGAAFGEAYLTAADMRAVSGLEIEQLRPARNVFGTRFEAPLQELVVKYCKKPQLEDPGNDWVNNPWFMAAKEKPGQGAPEEAAPAGP